MKELKLEINQEGYIKKFIEKCPRNKMDLFEYSFLDDEGLAKRLYEKAKGLLQKKDAYCIVATEDEKPVGIICVEKDIFDSTILELNCYKITEMTFISNDFADIKKVIQAFFSKLTILIKPELSLPVHFSISLSNNIENAVAVFNALVANGFYYINTLLSFGFKSSNYSELLNKFPVNKGIKVREAHAGDVEEIKVIAKNSFEYSRFHLDPYIDNKKADSLMMISAENSVINKFADIFFVAEHNNRIVGYYSAKRKQIKPFNFFLGEVIISAVDSTCRGLGVFSLMNVEIVKWFASKTDFSELGTYLSNVPIQKTWIRSNLKIVRGSHQLSKLLMHDGQK